MRVHLFGVRGSLPTPGSRYVRYGGNTSCVAIAADGADPTLVLDFGTGARNLASHLAGRRFEGAVLLGHLHWDHILGLPFFPAPGEPAPRITVHLPAQGDPVEALSRPMSPPAFPLSPTRLRGDWSFTSLEEGDHEISGFRVTAREVPHGGGRTFGYRVTDGKVAVAYVSDHSPTLLGPGSEGLGIHHEAALELTSGADLLIHDSQYTPEEFAERALWGHCVWEYPLALARHAGVRRVVLTHHDPGHDDDFLDTIAARLPENAALAVEGTTIEL